MISNYLVFMFTVTRVLKLAEMLIEIIAHGGVI